MKRIILLFITGIVAISSGASGQETLTLQKCYDFARQNSPLNRELTTTREIGQLKDRNLSTGWYPSLDAGGTFVYNTSVVDLSGTLGSLPIPGIADAIKPLPNEQYKVTVDIQQMIYDGGAISSARQLQQAELLVNEQQVEAELFKLRGLVNQYYFNILFLDRQRDLLKNYLVLIDKQIIITGSAQAEGVMIKTDADRLKIEKIRLEQQLRENRINRNANLNMLCEITGAILDTAVALSMPVVDIPTMTVLTRPELQVLELKKGQLDASVEIIQSSRMPKAFVFATAGMGNPPGSDFFRNEFAPYGVIGAAVKWNIFDWNRSDHEKRIIGLQKEILEDRKADLEGNLLRLLEARKAEIEGLETLLKTDDELIVLRSGITATALSQYKNGTITLADYLKELNAEQEARLTFELHHISLARAKTEYLNIAGQNL
jgi:outer membrane protein TolC